MKPLIILTNDDGIDSPGLQMAAEAIADLGELLVVAPLRQQSSTGRSFARYTDGQIERREILTSNGSWPGVAVDNTPAFAARWGVRVLAPRRPDLVVSGINYGENLGTVITISGTVGAAIEAAAFGVPALAVGLQAPVANHFVYNDALDFTAAAHFTRYFARRLLAGKLPPGVDLLKVDVPADATPDTPWTLTRVSRQGYFEPVIQEESLDCWRLAGFAVQLNMDTLETDSDVYALAVNRIVAVAPLTIDLTAHGHWAELDTLLRET